MSNVQHPPAHSYTAVSMKRSSGGEEGEQGGEGAGGGGAGDGGGTDGEAGGGAKSPFAAAAALMKGNSGSDGAA